MTEVERLRTAQRLTIPELALAARVSTSTIKRMEMTASDRKGGINIDSACLVARALGAEVSDVFPNMELTVAGRPAQTGGNYKKKTRRKIANCPECGTEVSDMERFAGQSECCSASLAA